MSVVALPIEKSQMCLLLSKLLPAGCSLRGHRSWAYKWWRLLSLPSTSGSSMGRRNWIITLRDLRIGAERPQRPESRVSQAALLASCMKPTGHTHAQPYHMLTSKSRVKTDREPWRSIYVFITPCLTIALFAVISWRRMLDSLNKSRAELHPRFWISEDHVAKCCCVLRSENSDMAPWLSTLPAGYRG